MEDLAKMIDLYGKFCADPKQGDPKLQAEMVMTTIIHQLQKARQDWLREEILRLEEAQHDDTCGDCDGTVVNTHLRNGEDCNSCHGTGMDGSCYTHNQALQTIIDRYQAELDQDKALQDSK